MMYEMSWRDLVKRYMKQEEIDTVLDQARLEKSKPMECVIQDSDDGIAWLDMIVIALPLYPRRFVKVLFRDKED